MLSTSSTWPSGVNANVVLVTNSTPAAQSVKRQAQGANALATWQITFSGAGGVGSLSSAPVVTLSGLSNPSALVVELFDSTIGGAPLLFYYNASSGQFVAFGSTFQIALSDFYYLEVVSGSIHGMTTFSYTGGSQSFVVPSGITSLTITAAGAQGGAADEGLTVAYAAPQGGSTTAMIAVTAGSTLDVEVGGTGASGAGGYNGGGAAGGTPPSAGLGGGGASDVRVGGNALNDRVVVAGGGGGNSQPNMFGGAGGAGGGLVGGSVVAGAATGGSQNAGGAAGGPCGTAAVAGTAGSFGAGGAGGSGLSNGAGGGGGWYGGGGGGGWGLLINSGPCTAEPAGAGGGGSSYVTPSATNVTMTQGTNSGAGSVTLVW